MKKYEKIQNRLDQMNKEHQDLKSQLEHLVKQLSDLGARLDKFDGLDARIAQIEACLADNGMHLSGNDKNLVETKTEPKAAKTEKSSLSCYEKEKIQRMRLESLAWRRLM